MTDYVGWVVGQVGLLGVSEVDMRFSDGIGDSGIGTFG